MKTLPVELESAQKTPPFEPVVRVTAFREKPTWELLTTDSGATPAVNDAVVAADGSIVRAYVSGSAGSRTIYTQRVTDPTDAAQWTAWTSTVTGVDHLALALALLSGGTLRLFYADGGNVCYRDSADDGATWGAEQTGPAVAPAGAEVSSLSSATGLDIFYTEADGNDVWYSACTTTWSAAAAWTGTGDAHQVDAAQKGSYYYLAFRLGDIEIAVIRFDGTTWDNQRTIIPADESSFGWYWPRIWYDADDQVTPGASGAFRLAAVGSRRSGTLWACHYIESDDGLFWTAPACVPLPVTTDKPINIIRLPASSFILSSNKYVYSWNGPTSVEMSGIKRLTIRQTGELGRGELELHLDNRDGAYSTFGQSGATCQALERGSRLQIELSLHPSAFILYVQFYVQSVRLLSEAGQGYECRLKATNGWGLLDEALVEAELSFEDSDLDDIIEALCAQAGIHRIAVADGADDFFTTPNVETFSVKVGTSLLVALANLVGQYGYRRVYARFDADGVMRFDTITASPSSDLQLEAFSLPPSSFNLHPIYAGLYGLACTPNHVVIVGNDNYAEAWDYSRIGVYGSQMRRILDRKLPDEAEADERAAEELLAQTEATREAWLTLPPALGLELWDVVQVTDPGAGISTEKLRVCELSLLLDYAEGAWIMELGGRGTSEG